MVMISGIEQIQDESIFVCKLIGKDKSMMQIHEEIRLFKILFQVACYLSYNVIYVM